MALAQGVTGGSPLLWPRVLLFGDSITQFSFQHGGWGAALADRLVRGRFFPLCRQLSLPYLGDSAQNTKRSIAFMCVLLDGRNSDVSSDSETGKCDVLNRGFSGYNTRWARIILPRLVGNRNSGDSPAAVVTIFFGANDSSLREENPRQHVPLDEFAANLSSMVRYLRSVGVAESHVILVTPPPLWEAAWEEECLAQGHRLNRRNSVAGEYAKACAQVAHDCGTEVLDLWTLMQKDNQDFSAYLSDGLHLSPKGNEFVFSHLWPLVEKKVSALPLLLPNWRDVEEAAPERSLLAE